MVLLNRNLYLQWINQSNPSSSSLVSFWWGGCEVGGCWGPAPWPGGSVSSRSLRDTGEGAFVAGKQQQREEMSVLLMGSSEKGKVCSSSGLFAWLPGTLRQPPGALPEPGAVPVPSPAQNAHREDALHGTGWGLSLTDVLRLIRSLHGT